MDFNIRDRVLLDRGTWVRVTDKVDRSDPATWETPDDLAVGMDNMGRWHVFAEWEVLEVAPEE